MITMEPFKVYQYYLALRLHFTTDNYDVIKQQGRVRASKQSFFKRKDLLAIKRVAETYSDKDIVDFLVSNFLFTNSLFTSAFVFVIKGNSTLLLSNSPFHVLGFLLLSNLITELVGLTFTLTFCLG